MPVDEKISELNAVVSLTGPELLPVVQAGDNKSALASDVLSYVTNNLSLGSTFGFSANGISLVQAANYAAMRALLDLEAGTDFYSIAAADAAISAAVATHVGLSDPHTQYLLESAVSVNGATLIGHTFAQMRSDLDLEAGTDFLSPAAIAAAYQPLAANLTTWAGVTPSANGQSLVSAANYAAMRALLDLEAGTDFYSIAATNAAIAAVISDTAYDATSWNGVTTIAPSKNAVRDKFAALAQADIAGLTITSTPTFGGLTVESANAFSPQLTVINTNDDANGPYYIIRKTPASDYIRSGDNFGNFLFQGKNSGGGNTNVAYLSCTATADAGASAIDSEYVFACTSGGSIGERMKIRAGIFHGSATGGDQGNNTINFGAVYDDGVLLCAPLNPDMTQEDWDAIVPDQLVPEEYILEPHETGKMIPAKEEVRIRLAQDGKPEEYNHVIEPARPETVMRKVVVKEASVEKTTHRTARRHFEMLASGFNPNSADSYVEHLRKHKALPGMPDLDEWKARMLNDGVVDKMSLSERNERLQLAVDYLATALADAVDRIKALESN